MFLRKSHSYFYSISLAQKIFLVCFFLSTLSLTIVPGLLMLQYTNLLQSQIEQKNINVLNQLAKHVDAALAEENFRHLQQLTSIWEDSDFTVAGSSVAAYHLFKSWEHYTMLHPTLDSACLYHLPSDTMLSSQEGLRYLFLSRADTPYAQYLKENADFSKKAQWLPAFALARAEDKKEPIQLISFFQPSSDLFLFNPPHYYLLLNYDVAYLERQILPVLDPNGYFEIADAGQLLYSGRPGEAEDRKFLMYSMVSSVSGWTYRYFVPVSFWGSPWLLMLCFGVGVSLTGLCLAFFLSKLLSKKLYRPLGNLLAAIGARSPEKEISPNEIDFIQTVFHELYSSKEILEANLPLFEYQIGRLIFNGKITGQEEIADKLKLTSLSLAAEQFRLFLLAFPQTALHKNPMLPYESVAYIKEAFFSEHQVLCVPYPENCISILMAAKEIAVDFEQIRREVSAVFESPCGLLISDCLKDFSEIGKAFSMLKAGRSYFALYGYEAVLTQEQIRQHQDTRLHLASLFMPSLEESLAHNPDKFLEKCREVLSFAKEKRIHFEDWIDFCRGLFYMLEAHSQTVGLSSAFLGLKKSCFSISCPQDYEYLCESYSDLWKAAAGAGKETDSSAEYIERIKRYVLQNINADLSLEAVADKFGLTPNYLSRIFHEYSQITFSNFLKEAKLKKAADLLKEKDTQVQNVAAAVGYQTPNYFNRIFKEYYGVTPLQYRRKYLQT